MATDRITRRQAMAAGLGAVAAGTAGGSPAPKTDPAASLVGKTVLPALPVIPSEYRPAGDTADAPRSLAGASYVVRAEKDGRVEVLDADGVACRTPRDKVVPLAEAVEFFSATLRANDKDTFALNARGWAHYLLGKPDRAVADFTEFLRLTPDEAAAGPSLPRRWEGLAHRGLVYAEQGEFEKGLADLDEAVTTARAEPVCWANRGYARDLAGDPTAALADYDAALKACPAFLLATNNKAWVLATCPEAKVRDGAAAVKLAKAACEATADREGMYLDTLAAAYAEAGRFADAAKAQEKALEDAGYAVRYGEDGQKRLKLYTAGKPFRTEPVKK